MAGREFTTIETFTVTGRGIGHIIHVGDTSPAVREHVLLDGQVCEVTGVEWPVRKGMTAIFVAPVDKP